MTPSNAAPDAARETAAPDAGSADADDSALLLALATSVPPPGAYAETERWRDFRAVFLGSDAGRRVFRELLAWGHMFRPSFAAGGAIDAYRMAVHEGERNLALKLLATVSREPPARPARAKSQRESDSHD